MIKLPVFAGSWKKQRSSRKTSNSASLTKLKFLIVWITTNCGKFFKQWEYRPPYLSPDKPVSQIATVRTGRGTISVQLSSVPQSFPTLCDSMNLSTPGLPVHHQLPESTQTMSIVSVMPCNHLILCHPLILLPSIFPSIRVFSNESALQIRWPKYWSFSFILPSNEHPGLISFKMDWLDLLAVQGTLKSLLQHHSSKASILWRSGFFIVQLSHPYLTLETPKP